MIVVEGLRVVYGERVAVDDVDLQVGTGQFYGLLGPNGAGKTSLIGCLTGLVQPHAGRVRIDGLDPSRERTRLARRVGLVPQELAFYATITARQNLVFFGRLQGLWGNALSTAIDRVLGLVQLAERADDRAITFSGGMKRRLNVAIGLLHAPALLVLDEPTVGVDAQSRAALLECFEAIAAGGTTVLYTTHLMEEAERLCDRVAIMDGGRIIAEDEPAALIAQYGTGTLTVDFDRAPPERLVADLLAGTLASAARTEGPRLELTVARPEPVLTHLSEQAARAGLAIASLTLPRPNLETVFLRLTGRRLRDGEEGV